MSSPTRIVALAILERNGRFLMQLRDDLPTILHPGIWGLFGGQLEAGETPEEALKRELSEEIHYSIEIFHPFRRYDGENLIRHIFHVPLSVETDELIQSEGQDMALLAPIDIRSGFYYSERIGETRALGKIHRQVLLDFIEVAV